ncbi:MAG TPA: FHA domain-containing protein [Chloroflexota bacterium]|nr:FHA domain-containing protein [Chloroflexota bacterium]
MNCPQCGTNNPADFAFCLQCGGPLSAAGGPGPELTPADPSAGPAVGSAAAFGGGGPTSARLRVEQGSVDQREFDLDKQVLVIGRRLGNDIVIHDTNVSRQHARLVRQDDGFSIEDMKSANGTVVNDERVVGVRPLRNGDVIRIGDAVFVFEMSELASMAEGMTLAVGSESSMTSLGPPLSLESPAELAPPPVAASTPLTPPPPIMDSGHTTVGESVFEDEEAAAFRAAAQPPAESPPAAGRPSPEPGPPLPSSATEALEAIRREFADLNRDLAAFASNLGDLAERVEGLERSLLEATSGLAGLAEAARGAQAQPLRDLQGFASELEAAGGPERLQPIVDLLDQLAAQPRDIELLLKLSQGAGTLNTLLRLHLRLVAAVPEIREALARIVG